MTEEIRLEGTEAFEGALYEIPNKRGEDMAELEIHPVANLFPPLTGEDYQELYRSMKEHGFDKRHPIILYEGKILDGANRYRISKELGIEPVFEEHTANGMGPEEFAKIENLARRHLNASQKATVAVELGLLQRAKKEANEKYSRMGQRTDLDPTLTPEAGSRLRPNQRAVKKVAQEIGVGQRAIETADWLKRNAPEEFEAVKRGEIGAESGQEAAKVPARYPDLASLPPAARIKEARRRDREAEREAAGPIVENVPDEVLDKLPDPVLSEERKWFYRSSQVWAALYRLDPKDVAEANEGQPNYADEIRVARNIRDWYAEYTEALEAVNRRGLRLVNKQEKGEE